MKRTMMVGLMVAGLLVSGAAANLFAQNGPGQGGKGCGYGGPPKSDKERAARQAACLEKNDVCPNGGPRANCQGYGQGGQGKGKGKGARQGLRDGTGPRSGNGTCPNARPQTQK